MRKLLAAAVAGLTLVGGVASAPFAAQAAAISTVRTADAYLQPAGDRGKRYYGQRHYGGRYYGDRYRGGYYGRGYGRGYYGGGYHGRRYYAPYYGGQYYASPYYGSPYYGYDNDDDEATAAILGGILGFALGAATAPNYNSGYYGQQPYCQPLYDRYTGRYLGCR